MKKSTFKKMLTSFFIGAIVMPTSSLKADENKIKQLQEATTQGDANAQNELGKMYAHGEGVEKNEIEAVRLFMIAVTQGHAAAQCNLGVMYETGRGVAKNEKEAVRLYHLG